MPTGYTYKIGEQENYTVKEYILNCARAFGYLGSMRDSSGEIPEKLEYDMYHKVELDKAKEEMKKYLDMSEEEISKQNDEDYQLKLNSHVKYTNEKLALSQKYDHFLMEINKWKIPSKEHAELQKFCISQIENSKTWDCSTKYDSYPDQISDKQWLQDKINNCNSDIKYHTEAWESHKQHIDNANNWLKLLRESLKDM